MGPLAGVLSRWPLRGGKQLPRGLKLLHSASYCRHIDNVHSICTRHVGDLVSEVTENLGLTFKVLLPHPNSTAKPGRAQPEALTGLQRWLRGKAALIQELAQEQHWQESSQSKRQATFSAMALPSIHPESFTHSTRAQQAPARSQSDVGYYRGSPASGPKDYYRPGMFRTWKTCRVTSGTWGNM